MFLVFALTGAHEEIDYSAKLKFSDDEGEEEGEEERTESNSDSRYVYIQCLKTTHYDCIVYGIKMGNENENAIFLILSEQQRSQDAPTATSRTRASDSGGDNRHTPPSNADNGPQPPSSKPGWAEEGGSSWGGQGAPSNYQVEMLNGSNRVLH